MIIITVFIVLSLLTMALSKTPSCSENSVSQAIQRMSSNIYLEELKVSANHNVVISPVSIHMAMSILYHGAKGNSRSQLKNALGLNRILEIDLMDEVTIILDKFRDLNDGNVTLNLANALYVAKDLEVNSEFKFLVENQFDAKIDALDFSNVKEAVEVINNWAAEKTNHLINKVVSEEVLDTEAKLVIMNAVYFKAKWLKPFNEKHTSKEPFTVPGKGEIETDFMFISTSLESAFIEELKSTLVALPYRDEDYKMLIFHPAESSNVEDLEKELFSNSNCKMVEHYLKQLKTEETDLLLPKFETGSDLSLVNHFKHLGVTDIFGAGANLTGIFDGNNAEVGVGEIVHKTKIKVSEEGSEAAAVTAVFSNKEFREKPEIYINSPFIFFIFDTKNNVPIFMGKIVDPSQSDE